jgi:hypothetical protein
VIWPFKLSFANQDTCVSAVSSTRQAKNYMIAAVGVFLCIVVGFAIFKIWPYLAPSGVATNGQSAAGGTGVEPDPASLSPQQYYSQKTPAGDTVFSLPLGEERSGGWSPNGFFYALSDGPFYSRRGIPVFFQPYDAFVSKPELFRGFRSDDLTGLSLKKPFPWNQRDFAEISRLKSLTHLFINARAFDAAGLKCLESLPKLALLSLTDTQVTGRELSHFARLGQIEWLIVPKMPGVTPLLEKLVESSRISNLEVVSCGLTDIDMKIIAHLTHVQSLSIGGNSFTIAGLKSLTALEHMQVLKMGGRPIDSKAIDVLKKFQQLQSLTIDATSWSEADRARLTEALPKDCLINAKATSPSEPSKKSY